MPFDKITIVNKGKEVEFDNFLLDTGSASTAIPAEIAAELGLDSLPADKILRIHGKNTLIKSPSVLWSLKTLLFR